MAERTCVREGPAKQPSLHLPPYHPPVAHQPIWAPKPVLPASWCYKHPAASPARHIVQFFIPLWTFPLPGGLNANQVFSLNSPDLIFARTNKLRQVSANAILVCCRAFEVTYIDCKSNDVLYCEQERGSSSGAPWR